MRKNQSTMASAVTLLTALRMFTNAENPCVGSLTYERYPGYELQGVPDDVIRLSSDPDSVMLSCAAKCREDGSLCQSWTFRPGHYSEGRWAESRCSLSRDRAPPEGTVQLSANHKSSYFNQICLRTNRMSSCANLTSAFTVYRDTDWSHPNNRTVAVSSRHSCMERCLEETSFVCRAALYNPSTKRCTMFRSAIETSVGRNGNSYYMENNCVHGGSRCEGNQVFVKEADVVMRGAREMVRLNAGSLKECTEKCRDDRAKLSFECLSFVFTEATKDCVLYEDDIYDPSVSVVSSPTSDLYQLVCMTSQLPVPGTNNEVAALYGREQLYFEDPVPFQRFRNSIITADYERTLRSIDLGRCLDECLHQPPPSKCMSVSYDPVRRECRLSRYDQSGSRIVYDAEHDYYENLLAKGSSRTYYPDDSYGSQSGNSGNRHVIDSRPVGGRRARCDSGGGDTFRQVRSRTRLRQQYVQRLETVNSLYECEQECLNERAFKCLSFNYMTSGSYRDNCELSDRGDVDLSQYDYENDNYWDFFALVGGGISGGCLDVSQTCDSDGMEFTLKIPEGFWGRIYTHNHYGRSQCYTRGNGGNVYSLRIPGPGGYPDCGTEQFGDTMTNIVVVQFVSDIQTDMDMKYNLTCTTRGPGSAVVTSGYIGAGSGQPIPISYLPAEHTLDSRVRLLIKYQGRPTTTIAVGDPLDFKLETQEGKNLLQDIFATNVIARDPYSDRFVELIDGNGCPVDPYVFPALGLSRADDGLETNFNAFKIPESNFLVFEATVRSCQSGCRPAVCDGFSGRDNSFGRRKRAVGEESEHEEEEGEEVSKVELREMFRVYESRETIPESDASSSLITGRTEEVCVTSGTHQAIVASLVTTVLLLLCTLTWAAIVYRKTRDLATKNRIADGDSSSSTAYLHNSGPFYMSNNQGANWSSGEPGRLQPQQRYLPGLQEQKKTRAAGGKSYRNNFADPSEPIYTDPSLFERSRSIRSLALQDQIQESAKL